MAEERIFDRDKDKKYRFRINENGEEEMYLASDYDEAEGDEVEFEVPEYFEDDEDAAFMTPEQLAIKKRKEEEELAQRAILLADCIKSAREDLQAENYSTALEALEKAEEIEPINGEVATLKLTALTRNFTNYDNLEEIANQSEKVKFHASKQAKAEMYEKCHDYIAEQLADLKADETKLNAENEQKKAERAVLFNKGLKKWSIIFGVNSAFFIAMLIVALVFSTQMFSVQNSSYIVLTIVFGALAFISFVVLVFTARGFNIALRRVRLNKKDTSSELGRTLIACRQQITYFTQILKSVS